MNEDLASGKKGVDGFFLSPAVEDPPTIPSNILLSAISAEQNTKEIAEPSVDPGRTLIQHQCHNSNPVK
ncbi:hypothetical protein RUM43_012303 [Polyplax serrata]|uniref:Uncharacterized protein n=1 Tax=Polyplax serrata TaxID=468196 RepID=A0AAN8P3P5_POLSC